MKVGIDFGNVTHEIVSNTGRVNIKGKVLNRTSRIAYQASAGHIFCSERVIFDDENLSFIPLKMYNLKGVDEPMMLYDIQKVEAVLYNKTML
jgi:class 3 adenylate cyclase